MKTSQDNLVALVTGSSSGFGLLTSIELARRGFAVIAGIRRMEAEAGLMEAAEQAGVQESIHAVRLDVTDETVVKQAVSYIRSQYGRLDVLVNNAGTAFGGFIEEVPAEVWLEQMNTNFHGMVRVTQAVLPLMRKQGKGRIIQMSSISGRIGFPGYGPYAASKFALEGFSECLALEAGPFGIDVVLVEPGAYGTPIWDKGFTQMSTAPGSPYQAMLNKVLAFSRKSAQQGGDPREVAGLVAHIACMKRPAFRYALPRSTRLTLQAGALLPGRLFQRIMASVLGKS
ncbi:SDR family oxidoreductase [Paenibacillus sp.]|jgi:NAD(P)-dependent dehydrogenase (short-subunit alcohol dehydrogenase family)|uniref:SDR family oxidoreductase n=1 Tax=Paenibacillus sp. TaxID=58172 RepID=UPI00281B7ABA|nr:SDR family oxidoreductase [Paenibacillus sp.]MDR0268308.1 SDR family oxidoreductase [Paenibacillus sp.]